MGSRAVRGSRTFQPIVLRRTHTTLRRYVVPRCQSLGRRSQLLCLARPPPQGNVHEGTEEHQEPDLHGNK